MTPMPSSAIHSRGTFLTLFATETTSTSWMLMLYGSLETRSTAHILPVSPASAALKPAWPRSKASSRSTLLAA